MTFILPSSRKFPVLPLSVTALVVVGGGLAGLLLSLHSGQQQTASSAQTDALGLTIFMVALGAVAGGYLASIVICAFKGKSRFALFGCLGFLAPAVGYSPGWGLIVLVLVGAIRLAKPTSRWARSYYGEDKMHAASLRFPVTPSAPTPQQHSTEQIPQTPAIPKAYERTVGVARSLDNHDEQRAPITLPPPVPATSRPTADSPLENELRGLAALKADGIISEEEFTAKKRALLGL